MRYGKASAAPLLLLAAFPGVASAEDPSGSTFGARSLGRGGTSIGDPQDCSPAMVNLAAASLREHYEIVAGIELATDSTLLERGSAVDTRTSVVSLALGYYHLSDDVTPAGDTLPGWAPASDELTDATEHQGFFGSVALPLAQRRVSLALYGRYDWRDSEQLGEDNAFNFGAGAAVAPTDYLTFSVVGRDLLDFGYPDEERSVGLGGRFDPGRYVGIQAEVSTEIDGTPVLDAVDFGGGLDVLPIEWLALRVGGQYTDHVPYATAGIGFLSDKADLDYGMSWQADDFGALRTWHELDLRVKF